MSARTSETKSKHSSTPTETAAPLLELPWTVDSHQDNRTPKWQRLYDPTLTVVTVSHLRYQGTIQATLEGPTSERSLKELARQYNASGKKATPHKKAFADLPAAARATASIKNYQGFTSAEFTPPPRKRLTSN